MTDEWESYCAWTGSFVETVSKFTYDASNLLIDVFGLTSNSTSSIGASSDGFTSAIGDFFQAIITYLAFDDFQLKLLKIFLSILLTLIFLIYITWHIYGERINERFVHPTKEQSEQVRKSALNLKLPQEHCQRYA